MPVTEALLAGLTTVFGLWAAVVAWAANRVIRQIDVAQNANARHHEDFHRYVREMERRVATLEARQK